MSGTRRQNTRSNNETGRVNTPFFAYGHLAPIGTKIVLVSLLYAQGAIFNQAGLQQPCMGAPEDPDTEQIIEELSLPATRPLIGRVTCLSGPGGASFNKAFRCSFPSEFSHTGSQGSTSVVGGMSSSQKVAVLRRAVVISRSSYQNDCRSVTCDLR